MTSIFELVKSKQAQLTVCAFFATLLLFGCNSKNPPATPSEQSEAPFSGETVNFNVPAELKLEANWQLILDEWSARTGAKAHFQSYQVAEISQLADETEVASSPAEHVIVFPLRDVSDLYEKGLLSPIPSGQQKELHWNDLFRGLTTAISTAGSGRIALPISAPVLVCYYRKDLLENAAHSPPSTWDDYQRLLTDLPNWAPGKVAVAPWSEAFRATMFFARAVNYAKHPDNYSVFLDIDTGRPLINSPPFIRALEESLVAIKQMPNDALHYSPADCRRAILTGEAAIAICFETINAHPNGLFGPAPKEQSEWTSESIDRPEDVQIAIARLPGATDVYNLSVSEWERSDHRGANYVTLVGFAGFGISGRQKANESEPVCWSALNSVAMENFETAFPNEMRTLCRESQQSDAFTWLSDELTAQEKDSYLRSVSRALFETQIVAELPFVENKQFRDVITTALSSVIEKNLDPTDVLDDAATKWEQLAEELGKERVRDSYRQRLGLPPKR